MAIPLPPRNQRDKETPSLEDAVQLTHRIRLLLEDVRDQLFGGMAIKKTKKLGSGNRNEVPLPLPSPKKRNTQLTPWTLRKSRNARWQ